MYFVENFVVNAEDLPPIMPSSKEKIETFVMTKSGKKPQLMFSMTL